MRTEPGDGHRQSRGLHIDCCMHSFFLVYFAVSNDSLSPNRPMTLMRTAVQWQRGIHTLANGGYSLGMTSVTFSLRGFGRGLWPLEK